MSYLYGLTKVYDITEARKRSRYFEDQSERDLWRVNEALKREIDLCSYTGHTWAYVDILFCKYEEYTSIVIATDLAEMYEEAGYKVKIQELFNSVDDKIKGYRVTVNWEEN